MERSQAVEVGNVWQSGSGVAVQVVAILKFSKIRFVKYVVIGIKNAPIRTLDSKAFLHTYSVLKVLR